MLPFTLALGLAIPLVTGYASENPREERSTTKTYREGSNTERKAPEANLSPSFSLDSRGAVVRSVGYERQPERKGPKSGWHEAGR